MSRRAVFLGSKAFGLSILRALIDAEPTILWSVIHPNDEADGRSALPEFRAFCDEMSVPLTVVEGPRTANELLLDQRPDFAFVCGWYFLIPEEILVSGPLFLGIHNSLLPKYRGGAPLVWSLINGDKTVGSTLFRFTPGMDDGPVYLQVAVEAAPDAGIGDVLAQLEAAFLEALPMNWPAIVSGKREAHEQNHALATYCGQRVPGDGQIDWRMSAGQVHDFVRAQTHPYPGAYTTGPLGRVRIWKCAPYCGPYFGVPGQVLERQSNAVVIACAHGSALVVKEASDDAGEFRLGVLFPSLATRLVSSIP